MQAHGLGGGNSELGLSLCLAPWVLNTTLQGFSIKEGNEKN